MVSSENQTTINEIDTATSDDTGNSIAEIITQAGKSVTDETEAEVTAHEREHILANGETAGDPILITSGDYLFAEDDISFSLFGTTYTFGRYYNSGINRGALLGKNWYFTLDTCVIRGRTPPASIDDNGNFISEYDVIHNLLDTAQQDKAKAESLLQNLEQAINDEIAECDDQIAIYEDLLQDLAPYKGQEAAEPYNTTAEEWKQWYIDKKDILQTQANTLIEDTKTKLDILKARVADLSAKLVTPELQKSLSEYNALIENSTIKARTGFSDNLYCGEKTLILYDERGTCYTYEIIAEPVMSTDGNFFPEGSATRNLISGDYSRVTLNSDGTVSWRRTDNQTWIYRADGLILRMQDIYGRGIDFNYSDNRLSSITTTIAGNKITLYSFGYENNRLVTISNDRDSTEKMTYHYNANGILDETTDIDNDVVNFEYDIDGHLTKIKKPYNTSVEIRYETIIDGKKWANITVDERGYEQKMLFYPLGIEGEANLDGENTGPYTILQSDGIQTKYYWNPITRKNWKIINPDGSSVSYKYDENMNVVQEIFMQGSLSNTTQYTYDSWGNVHTATYNDKSTEIWEYNENNQLVSYKDRDGVTVIYNYNSDSTLDSVYSNSALVFKGTYSNFLLESSIDSRNVNVSYKYDMFGNVTERTTGSGGNVIKESYKYDGRNRVKEYTDGLNRVTTYQYDDKKVIETAPNGLVTTYTYNSRKDLIQVSMEDKNTGEKRITDYHYDESHNLHYITDPSIIAENKEPIPLVTYTYDGNNNLTSTTYHDGVNSWIITNEYKNGRIQSVSRVKANDSATANYKENYSYSVTEDFFITEISILGNNPRRYSYDRWYRPAKVENELRESTEIIVSKAGRIVSEQSNYGGTYTTLYNWNSAGTTVSQYEGNQNSESIITVYNADGSIKETTNRLNEKTEYSYNNYGQLSKIKNPERAIWYFYDKAGRIKGQYITEPEENDYRKADTFVTYTYDDFKRTVTVNHGDEYSEKILLNAFGEVTCVTDGQNNSIKYTYNTLGQTIQVIDGYGKSTSYEYNALGSVSKITYPDDTYEIYEYDHLGNITSVRVVNSSTNLDKITASYTYSTDGLLEKVEELGNPVIEYKYDAIGRITEVKTAGIVTEKYVYTERGRTVTALDAAGKSYSYDYDEFGRLTSESNRLEDTQSYGYDAENALNVKKDFAGKETTYEYVASTRTKTTTFADNSTEVYTYTPSGNIASVTGETGTITYKYNKAGLLVEQVDSNAGETTEYRYDNAGRRSIVISDSRTIRYTYGKNGETKTVTDSTNGTSVEFLYDVMGRETDRKLANGNTQTTSYDSLGRTKSIKQTNKNGTIIFAEAYLYNDKGLRYATVNSDGQVTYYEYNDFYQLSKVTYPWSEELEKKAREEALAEGLTPGYVNVEWQPQTADEQILLQAAYLSISGTRIRTWYGYQYQESTGELPSTERVWTESYTYDINGNRESKTTAFGTIWYTYDDENRLRFSGREKLVNTEAEIGGRTTNWDTATSNEWYAATDDVNYTATGLRGTRYTYDANGNMLSSENLYSVKFYDYNDSNRMKLSTVTDLRDHSYTATTYAYDALGRRTLTQTEGHTAERTLYDGQSFEILRQGTADSNGSFVSTDVAKGRFSYGFGFPFTSYTTYNSTGNWLLDLFFGGMWGFGAGAHGSNQGEAVDPEYYDIENLYPLYGNGEAVATYEEDLVYSPHETFWSNWKGFYSGLFGTRESYYSTYSETNYFATDLLGSVKVTTNARGEVTGKTSYDVFGSLYGSNGTLAESSLMFAYTGKTWNGITELSNYGFRDYAPQIARFTTVDPIRDGNNWYAYVHNDPVNLRDLWGLWTNNNDGSFTAQKGDTLYGLQQETGREWVSFDYEGKPELLQIGQTVSVTNQEKTTSNIVIDSTIEAVKHYYNGNGESVILGDETIKALKDSPEQEYNRKALANGTAKSTTQRYGVDLTDSTYHVGDTVVTYEKSEGTKYRVVTYTGFVDDGFWDVLPGDGDGIGPKKELPGGTPYSYTPYTWTEVYEKEGSCSND